MSKVSYNLYQVKRGEEHVVLLFNGLSPEILSMIAEEQGLVLAQPVSANDANYLAAEEGYSEENCNMIDGRIDTQSKLTPGDDTEPQPERGKDKDKKPSVLKKLKEKQAEIPAIRKVANDKGLDILSLS